MRIKQQDNDFRPAGIYVSSEQFGGFAEMVSIQQIHSDREIDVMTVTTLGAVDLISKLASRLAIVAAVQLNKKESK
jgi:hypothetical protein